MGLAYLPICTFTINQSQILFKYTSPMDPMVELFFGMFHGQGAPGIWWPCYSHSYALHCCEPRICHQFTLVILQVFAGLCPCYSCIYININIFIYLYIRTNIYKIKGLLIGSIGHYKDPYEQISIMDCHKGFDRWMT